MIVALLLIVGLASTPSRADTSSVPVAGPPSNSAPFLETFPQLKDYLYEEPHSGFYLGHGGSPIGLIGSTYMFTVDIFGLHWIKDRYDIEGINISYGLGRGSSSEFTSQRFTFRAAPKYRVLGPISIGPLIGYELVTFPDVDARIFRGGFIEPNSEPFSGRGWIYGIAASQTFPYNKKYLFKLDESIYKENYSTKTTSEGWSYIYDDPKVQLDNSQIAAGTVMMIEASFLY